MEEKTIQKIIRISFKLIKEKGYDNVTINEICKEVQISKHTFYYYFESKEDIINKIHEVVPIFNNDDLAHMISIESPLEQYYQIIKLQAMHSELMGVEITKKLMLNHLNQDFTFKTKRKAHIGTMATTFIQRAQQQNEIRNQSDPKKLVRACALATVGITQMWAFDNGSFDLKERLFTIINTILDVA